MLNVVQPYSRLVHFDEDGNRAEFTRRIGIGLLRKIEWNARISHGSEEAQTTDSWRRFITAVVMDRGDWSVVEHSTVTVDTLIDRGISHEWVRHRLFSFTQSSTRFINYAKKMPPSFVYPDPDNWEGYIDDPDWCEAVVKSEETYRKMLGRGDAPQIARSVFPNALSTRISTTGNLRNWRLMMLMRTTKEAHPQMRQVSIPQLAEFKEKIPLIFDDIEPLARQVDNLKKPR